MIYYDVGKFSINICREDMMSLYEEQIEAVTPFYHDTFDKFVEWFSTNCVFHIQFITCDIPPHQTMSGKPYTLKYILK